MKTRYDELIQLVEAATTDNFVELVKMTQLNPELDFRYANLRGINFSNTDLSGFDFTGANLANCNFDNAKISKTILLNTTIENSLLHKASDWDEYAKRYVSAVCVKNIENITKFLLVRSTRGRRIFPKSRLKPGESTEAGALRCALLEGGVLGKILGEEPTVFRDFNLEARKEYIVTALLVDCVSSARPSEAFRDPEWFSIQEAREVFLENRDLKYANELIKAINWYDDKLHKGNRKRYKVGVVPYRMHKGKVQILLITTRARRRWSLPKGNLTEYETPEHCAAKEALQEAGIEGRILSGSLGVYDYNQQDIIHNLEVFPMEVKRYYDDWPEKGIREREWFDVSKAISVVENKQIKRVISAFKSSTLWLDKA